LTLAIDEWVWTVDLDTVNNMAVLGDCIIPIQMKKREVLMRRVRFGQLAAVVTLPLAIAGVDASIAAAAPASGKVSATPAIVIARAASGSQNFSPSVPVTKIKGQGRTAIFKPSSLTASEDTTGGECEESPMFTSFVIKNTGTSTAFLAFDGTAVGSIRSRQSVPVCIAGQSAGTQLTLNLSNKKTTKTYSGEITVTTSD
jgi:hypothetical protein